MSFPVPSMPPQNVAVKDQLSLKSIHVKWDPVPAGHVNGDLQGYKLTYKLMEASGKHVRDKKEIVLTLGPHNRFTVMKDLRSCSVYKIKMAAFTKRGSGPYSEYIIAGKSRFLLSGWEITLLELKGAEHVYLTLNMN